MTSGTLLPNLDRRSVIKAAAAAGIAQFAAPFVITARAADDDQVRPRRSADRHLCRARQERADRLPTGDRQINAKGGILGRQAQLLVEDSTSADTGIAVQKARKLIERDKVDFLLGNVNSAMALAIGELSNQAEDIAHRHRRPYRFGHRHRLPLERVPRLQHDADGNQRGVEDAVQQIRQEVVFSSRPTTPSATPCSRASRPASRSSAAPRSAPR